MLRVKEVPQDQDVDGLTENSVRCELTVLLKIVKDIGYKSLYYFTFARFNPWHNRTIYSG